MKTEYLGLSAVGWHTMIDSWWSKVLAGFLLANVVLGSLYIVYRVVVWIEKFLIKRRSKVVVPASVARCLARLKRDTKQKSLKITTSEELKSFGVFLGGFSSPPSFAQQRLLSQWDVVVLNPLEEKVLEALSNCQSKTKHTIGRVDLCTVVNSERSSSNDEVVRSLHLVAQTVSTHFEDPESGNSPFTGILLAGFQGHFQPAVLNEVVSYLNALGFDVWLELALPDYLPERYSREVRMESIRGIVYRNGTIRPDGGIQDYFQMSEMRAAMRTIAAQRVPHGPPIMMWETVEDSTPIDYAVVQRSFNWCSYNSALLWIGTTSALTNAAAETTQMVTSKPLGALMWLKGDDNMKAHDIWRSNDNISKMPCMDDSIYDSLESFIPGLRAKLRLIPPEEKNRRHSDESLVSRLEWKSHINSHMWINPLSVSAEGEDFTGLGCFHLGLQVTAREFDDILRMQRHLKDLDLLQRMSQTHLRQISSQLQALQDAHSPGAVSPMFQAVKDLLDLLATTSDDGESLIQVYVGLHSGFQTSSGIQFWGLYDIDPSSGVLYIYLSSKSQDRTGTLLHTFLSSRGFSRTECFTAEAELAMSEQHSGLSDTWMLPTRLVHDLQSLTPAETLLFLKRLTLFGGKADFDLLARIRACCNHQLLDVPTLNQLRALASNGYLRGEILEEDLVMARLAWLDERECWRPKTMAAVSVFKDVQVRLLGVLMGGETELLGKLSVAIQVIVQKGQIDGGADIFALAVFSAFRKLALDEVYLEVLDRNPYPNHTTIQAGCFAENFALGSRCDSFFDMTPMCLARIISDRYRAYYMKHQPPPREEGFTELPTAYAAMQVDLDPQNGEEELPSYYQFTFFGIFAVPALLDVMLLTTIGRGLYLTTFMSSTEKTIATTALMLALLLCGGFGTWISSGGCYYFYANAFPAMNMFVLTRFTAGLAVGLVFGVGGMIGVIVVKGILSGLVFLFYFVMLTTYLLTLSVLSIYQLPGSRFQSGRTVIVTCIPILFISPVVTLFLQHDIAVYLSVLTVFLFSLLLGCRKIISQWSTWYLNIPSVTDTEVINWYTKTRKASHSVDSPEEVDEDSLMPKARNALHAAVLKECDRSSWTKSTTDSLVSKLANGYYATMFLMRWFSKHKRTRMPLPYSSTWNLTLGAALENMTNMQKGLKLHNAFLHWRHTGADVFSGVLYFVVALLDKWTALVTGGDLVGLSAASSVEYHLAIGFGLCYYLIGAVSLDTVSQPLWSAANENTVQRIPSLKFLRQATKNDARARRVLYWTSLGKFFLLHLWGMAVTAALMWVFESSRNATTMYLAYVGAYTGLLWYQYNKIYCANEGAKSLIAATIFGLPTGIVLHRYLPNLAYSGVIGLAVATWIAAFHSMWLAKIGWPTAKVSTKNGSSSDIDDKNNTARYSTGALEPYPELSQATLSRIFDAVSALPDDQRYRLDPSQHPGLRIVELLQSQMHSKMPEFLQRSFPAGDDLLRQVIELWGTGKTMVELVSERHVPQPEQNIRSISLKSGDTLYLFVIVGPDVTGDLSTLNVDRNWRMIAEAVVQSTLEMHIGLSHDHSVLAELLIVDHLDDAEPSIPEGVRRQLSSCVERSRVINNSDLISLRYLLLGLDCEREWDNLPSGVRSYLLQRSLQRQAPLDADDEDYLRSKLLTDDCSDLEEHVARCDLADNLARSILNYAKALDANCPPDEDDADGQNSNWEKLVSSFPSAKAKDSGSLLYLFKLMSTRLHQKLYNCIKFLVLSLTADPEFQRELNYKINGTLLRWPLTFFLNGLWSYCKALQSLLFPLVLLHGRDSISRLHSNMKGTKTIIEKNKIVIESVNGPSTCFFAIQPDKSLRLAQYAGRHDTEPTEPKQLMAVNTYTDKLVLRRREEYNKQAIANAFEYDYPVGKNSRSKLPLQRRCVDGDMRGQLVQYDYRGYIYSGSATRGVNSFQFTYWYRRNAKFEDELLRGEYVFPHITIKVLWSMPPKNHPERLDEWIPFKTVTEATFIQGSDTYHASWGYDHKFHPEVSTTLNDQPVETPPMISEDWFKVLQKPSNCGFLSDNPLLSFSSIKTNPLTRLLRLNIKRYPISTSHARNQLWKAWKGGKDLDAITARWLDERLLRSDHSLKTYWRNRDMGRLGAAKAYLDQQADTIMARVDVAPEISSWTHIAFKISDLYGFGQGGDAKINTRTVSTQWGDSDNELHILAMDTSTWPNEPGGVSACRRDMVNDLKTIKWHIVAECANDYGVPKFQIEKNVQSLTVLPLWGLDFLNPTHGILESSLDSAVVQRSFDTRTADIKKNFLPILTSLVKCTRTLHLTRQHIEEATQALVDLNTYFESTRNWNDVWSSDIVKQKWRELWLDDDVEDMLTISQWWDFERPTILQLDQALNMWSRYLFIFSIPVPEQIPDVFQASHHFTGATYGILCKVKRKCTLHVWDHCISFRELTTFMSSAVSFDTPFINSSLISLGHLSCVLLEHHADVVLPCCDYFNPGWEVELGTAEGNLGHRRTFARKIDPVVNGICNMEKFEPIKTIKTDKPTVVMLSHIQYVKDIKNAIVATDLIVNKWGFTDYRLHIYGNMERAASISAECQELIASKGLREHCILKGLGNPSLVLQDAWLFLNSSISEGLPLAMGEAALTGVPVVCTDVGASFCVVTDRETGDRFSEVVPPNDPESLARAQISVMGLLGRWSAYADDDPNTPAPVLAYPTPSPEQVQQISQRIYAKTEQRRRLGMLGRENVLKNFSEERYLREHEQMLWIGKHRSGSYRATQRKAELARPGILNEWYTHEKMGSSASLLPPRRNPRLSPQSWVSFSSEMEKKGYSSSPLSSRPSSVRELFRKPPTKPW
ncbi:putative glycosyl transferase [Clohesyomyces aquaticus]|uniref:Putative glycosyl transferase n=1 Tax=Clohesyomyces aquaticus TaxID=1231657 RepID=A0A1Y2A904_9PLEO|nr:putative glycosyl transferase [Clohesyomyces aquaticus]